MQAPTGPYDLMVVGGGIVGCALALSVARHHPRRRIAIVEARAPHHTVLDPRLYALSASSRLLLIRLGVWQEADAQAVYAMQITGGPRAADGRTEVSAYEARQEALAWMVNAGVLTHHLQSVAQRHPQIDWLAPARPLALRTSDEVAAVELDQGTVVCARLLAAADGRKSAIREWAGIEAHEHAYGERGLVANFSCERPHRGIARQWFLADSTLAWLPQADGTISIVWSLPAERAVALGQLAPEELARIVSQAGQHALGRLAPVGASGSDDLAWARSFPLSRLSVERILGPRLVLVGDAAHGVHPLSGHGINLGLGDVMTLDHLIGAIPAGHDIGDPLRLMRYPVARNEDTLLIREGTHLLHTLFHTRLPGLPGLRRLGMQLTDRLPPVKSLLVRLAAGPSAVAVSAAAD